MQRSFGLVVTNSSSSVVTCRCVTHFSTVSSALSTSSIYRASSLVMLGWRMLHTTGGYTVILLVQSLFSVQKVRVQEIFVGLILISSSPCRSMRRSRSTPHTVLYFQPRPSKTLHVPGISQLEGCLGIPPKFISTLMSQ